MSVHIRRFTSNYICFFRRNKKTYYVLEWNSSSMKWIRAMPELPDLTLHLSNTSRDAEGNISVATYAGGRANNIHVTGDGFYLMSGNICIPILKSDTSLSNAFMMTEYRALETPFTTTDINLWSISIPEPIYITVIHPIPPPLAILQGKLPRRIALLIAMNASTNNEICPISTNIISPINASVTTCFHVFDTDAINEWVKVHPINTPCPICRSPCYVTSAVDVSSVVDVTSAVDVSSVVDVTSVVDVSSD